MKLMFQSLGDDIVTIVTQINKKKDKVYFFNDPETAITMDDGKKD